MLLQLSVQNFAIIEYSEINFEKGFTIITGETGAGKSILLGALSLILGQRADKKAILNPDKKAVIEGIFALNKTEYSSFFLHHDLDFEEQTIVRRELTPSGKSRAFINDTPVTLETLKALTSQLVDLHRQHESLSITTANFQREIVDLYAGHSTEVQAYHQLYKSYLKKKTLLVQQQQQQAEAVKEKDFLTYQHKELEEANLQAGELEQVEQQLNSLQNNEEIQQGLSFIRQAFEQENSSVEQLRSLRSELLKLVKLNPAFQELEGRLSSLVIELEDLEQELSSFDLESDIDEETILQLTERSDLLNRLLSKHQVNTEEELLQVAQNIAQQFNSFEQYADEIQVLEKEINQLEKELQQQAGVLTANRTAIQHPLQEEVQQLLQQVGMPKANVLVELISKEEFLPYGREEVQLLFTANAGQTPQSLKSVASGGELSRLMLALKTLVADKTTLPTMIFDEIDTGISGEVAVKVGQLLQKLASKHQIISITHLPQIAAKGNQHLKVYKNDETGVTRSNVKQLSSQERVVEIAEMLSGANPSELSLQAAKEMM